MRSGAPRHVPACLCKTAQTHPVPWHGKSNPFFTMSKISITSHAAGKSCLVLWVVQPPAPVVPETNGNHATRDSRTATAVGGARRDRTDDLLLAKQALSQLSYGPGRGQTSVISCQSVLITDD